MAARSPCAGRVGSTATLGVLMPMGRENEAGSRRAEVDGVKGVVAFGWV
jgi:hypothetical protein